MNPLEVFIEKASSREDLELSVTLYQPPFITETTFLSFQFSISPSG